MHMLLFNKYLKYVIAGVRLKAGFELSKNKLGVEICLFIVTVIIHRRFSIINNGGGLKLTPKVSQGTLFEGLSKQLGDSTPNPLAIQTLFEMLSRKGQKEQNFQTGRNERMLRRMNDTEVLGNTFKGPHI
jgi:hypothetical protein